MAVADPVAIGHDPPPLHPPENHLVQRAGRRFRAKSGTEDSGQRAESLETGLAGDSEDRLPSLVLLGNVPYYVLQGR